MSYGTASFPLPHPHPTFAEEMCFVLSQNPLHAAHQKCNLQFLSYRKNPLEDCHEQARFFWLIRIRRLLSRRPTNWIKQDKTVTADLAPPSRNGHYSKQRKTDLKIMKPLIDALIAVREPNQLVLKPNKARAGFV